MHWEGLRNNVDISACNDRQRCCVDELLQAMAMLRVRRLASHPASPLTNSQFMPDSFLILVKGCIQGQAKGQHRNRWGYLADKVAKVG